MRKDNFKLIIWSNTFACGIKLIDDQHKHLIDLVNEMFNHVTGNEEQEQQYFNKIIQEAVKYIKIHFSTEEKIMLATKFSGCQEHKRAHDNFILTVVNIVSDSTSGKRFSLYSFTKFLKDWILSHIAVMDKQYFTYLKQIATHKVNGKLSITSADIQSVTNRDAGFPSAVNQ